MITEIVEKIIRNYNEEDAAMVTRAYRIAEYELKERERGNNRPFIEHPLGVVSIISEIGLMADSVTAVFLHEANRFKAENSSDLNRTALFNSYKSDFPKEIVDIVAGLKHSFNKTPGDKSRCRTLPQTHRFLLKRPEGNLN